MLTITLPKGTVFLAARRPVLGQQFGIRVYKQYFNFACSHFMIFKDGTREPLHGHNYRVSLKGDALELEGDMVFDFLDIKPIVRQVCDELDHRLLLPGESHQLKISEDGQNFRLVTPDTSYFSIPQKDCLILPIENTSAERLAIYLTEKIVQLVREKYSFSFRSLEIEVEETPGQCATYQWFS